MKAQLIEKILERYPNQKKHVNTLFKDMLAFLWLSHEHARLRQKTPENKALQFSMVMHTEMRLIDEMWHDFILMTKDYMNFCHQHFGYYLHHQVNQRATQPDETTLIKESKLFFSFIYDKLGETILSRWFDSAA